MYYLVIIDGDPVGLYTAMSDVVNTYKGKDFLVYKMCANSNRCARTGWKCLMFCSTFSKSANGVIPCRVCEKYAIANRSGPRHLSGGIETSRVGKRPKLHICNLGVQLQKQY